MFVWGGGRTAGEKRRKRIGRVGYGSGSGWRKVLDVFVFIR